MTGPAAVAFAPSFPLETERLSLRPLQPDDLDFYADLYAREDTVRSFDEILSGKCDDMPEQAFEMTGTIDDARNKAADLAKKG